MTGLPDVPDLYAALRQSGTAPEGLEALIAASPPAVQTRLATIDRGLMRAILRAGQGLPPVETGPAIIRALHAATPALLFDPALLAGPVIALPTRGERPEMPAFSDPAFDAWFTATGASHGIGLYGEDRRVYASAQFADSASPERRTIHLGLDVFAPAGTPVYAPFAGRVHLLTYNADPLDYGHTLILRHDLGGCAFFTLYGHLGASLPRLLAPGAEVAAGQHIADLGDWPENGGWAPHLHFQIVTDMLEQTGNFFGVGHRSLWDVWQSISPDPNLILRLPATAFAL